MKTTKLRRYLKGTIGTALCVVELFAAQIEVTADHIEADGSALIATGGVMVYYDNAVLRADRAVYNKRTHHLSLDGHVEAIGYRNSKEQASHIDIDTQTHEVLFKELFYTNANDIWLLTHHANRKEGNYTFGPSILSSCDVSDPVWKMRFSSSHYDSAAKYMKLYDATVYLWDVPVMYTPYLAFSTDNRRKSGFLFPRLGYTAEEGFVYEQPIFWAIGDNMDLEIAPQIRTDRSIGAYATFRFVDSPVSRGQLRIGYFKDKSSYVAKHNLPEDKHYGLQFVYNRDEVLAKRWGENYHDGIYADITLLNDIDYLNLQKSGGFGIFGQSPIQQSIVNYYVDNNRWYGGINAKYFIDTRLSSNDATLQTLPSLQAHKYLSHFFLNNIIYSFDMQLRNIYRKEGMTSKQIEGRIPIEWTTSWLNDYLSLTLGESFYFGKFFFNKGNDAVVYDDLQYVNNVHYAKLFSDLTGRYGRYIHVVQPSVSYTIPGGESFDPVSLDALISQQEEVKGLVSVGFPEKHLTVGLNQYLYDDAMQLIFFQRLKQRYYPNRAYETSDLENEMAYNWKNWHLYNNIVYSFEFGKVRESSSFITYRDEAYFISLGHTYKQEFDDETSHVVSNDLQLDFRYDINDKVGINGRWNYDLQERGLERWMIGGNYKRDCWSVYASIGADVRPQPTTATGEIKYTQEYTFYLQLNFAPFGSISSSMFDTVFGQNNAF